MGLFIAEDPASAMEVHDCWQDTAHALWSDNAQRNLTSWAAGNGAVLDVGRQLCDIAGFLDANEDVASVSR